MGMPFAESKIFTGNKAKVIDEKGMVIQEASEFNAKATPEHADVKVLGVGATGAKLTGWKGTGTMKRLEISPALNRAIAEGVRDGKEFVTQLVCECGNDDSETYRVLLLNVKFTGDVDVAKYTAQSMTELDLNFTFTDFKYL